MFERVWCAVNDEKYIKLINKIDSVLGHEPGIIHKDMCFESLSKNELIMVHTNLHRFYPKGTKDVSKNDIEQLHTKVKELIGHRYFDQLDRVGIE